MAGRGPAPAPAAIRLLKGNGKDRDVAGRKVARQPRTVAMRPPKPDLPPDGDRMWELVVPELERMELLGQIDLGALEAYCILYHELHNHRGPQGLATLATALVRVGSALGLDPTSRLRMKLPEVEDDDESAVFGTG